MRKYNVTQQYAKDVEKPIAEFTEYDDAIFFIERKSLADKEKNSYLIYRLFDDQKLLKEFNKEKITCPINIGLYAVGDRDLPRSIGHFKISKDSVAAHAFAAFINLNDAELFNEDKLSNLQLETTYYIFNQETLVTQMNQRIKKL